MCIVLMIHILLALLNYDAMNTSILSLGVPVDKLLLSVYLGDRDCQVTSDICSNLEDDAIHFFFFLNFTCFSFILTCFKVTLSVISFKTRLIYFIIRFYL